ncbi:MAG: hypothetical protein LBT51_00470 [Fusobacteriaceae bacterium]|nr:hypothetical protein [Fusobacteriaceae bacterium]
MKKYIIITILILINTSIFGVSRGESVEKIYYENGQLESSIEYLDGLKNGIAIVYSKNGLIQVKGSFKKDMRHGLWTFYFEGSSTLQAVEFYENDRLQGKQSYFYPNGRLKNISVYLDNGKTGTWEWYTEEGKLEAAIKYRNDYRGLVSIYDSAGRMTAQGPIVDEYRNGVWRFYDENGFLLYSMNYKRGNQVGHYEAYDRDGTLVITGIVDEDGNMLIDMDGKNEIIDSVLRRE